MATDFAKNFSLLGVVMVDVAVTPVSQSILLIECL